MFTFKIECSSDISELNIKFSGQTTSVSVVKDVGDTGVLDNSESNPALSAMDRVSLRPVKDTSTKSSTPIVEEPLVIPSTNNRPLAVDDGFAGQTL